MQAKKHLRQELSCITYTKNISMSLTPRKLVASIPGIDEEGNARVIRPVSEVTNCFTCYGLSDWVTHRMANGGL